MFLVSGGRRITARVVTKAVARAGRRLKLHLHPIYSATHTRRGYMSSGQICWGSRSCWGMSLWTRRRSTRASVRPGSGRPFGG